MNKKGYYTYEIIEEIKNIIDRHIPSSGLNRDDLALELWNRINEMTRFNNE
jgi:hypothetical protein